MTHREFKLTVTKEIRNFISSTIAPVAYNIGDIMITDEATFLQLQSGQTITRFTREGSIEFDKYNFENEVAVTEVTVEYAVRGLGQRKSKKVD